MGGGKGYYVFHVAAVGDEEDDKEAAVDVLVAYVVEVFVTRPRFEQAAGIATNVRADWLNVLPLFVDAWFLF